MRTTPQHLVEDYTSKGWWGTDTLNSLFSEAVADAADRPALADPPNRDALVGGSALRYTFGELDVATTELSTALHAAGLRQGDEILVQDENLLDMATAISGSGPAYHYMMMEAMMSDLSNVGSLTISSRSLMSPGPNPSAPQSRW